MAFLPRNINTKPKFEKAIFADLTKEQLFNIIEKYSTGYYPNVVLSIEPTNVFSNTSRTYATSYNVLVFASRQSASLADIVAEFKKLLVYHKPKK